MKYSRAERKQITIACIIDAAWYIFTSKGFKGATIKDIAKLAGVSTGCIYVHFGSKQKLADFTAQNFYNQVVNLYGKNIPKVQDLFNVLRIQTEIFIEFGETYKKINEYSNKSKSMQKSLNNAYLFLLDKFLNAINENSLSENASRMSKKDLFDIWFGLLTRILDTDTQNLDWDQKTNLKYTTIYKFVSLILEKSTEIENILLQLQNKQYN